MSAKKRRRPVHSRYAEFPRYVTVAERKANAKKASKAMQQHGSKPSPVHIEGRQIANTFWGKAWCEHLEKFSDFENRLPRGRTYVRNGSVIHLKIEEGVIQASVSGSDIYQIRIKINKLPDKKWQAIKSQCGGDIGSALELLQGKISTNVLRAVTNRDHGLFPSPNEITLDCDCPDRALLCKHLAAVLYGIGARLDQSPELLFLLRGVDHEELIKAELVFDTDTQTGNELTGDLTAIFGIDIDDAFIPTDIADSSRRNSVKKRRIHKKETLRARAGSAKQKDKSKRKSTVSTADKKPASQSAATEKRSTATTLGSGINISRGIRASHLKKLRRTHNLSVVDLAQLSGISSNTIHTWENRVGVITMRGNSLQAISAVFEMTATQIKRKLPK